MGENGNKGDGKMEIRIRCWTENGWEWEWE